jgi:cytochrome P450
MTDTEPITLPLAPTDAVHPPRELLALREGRPIARVRFTDGKVGWVVTRRATVRAVLADPRFSARQELRSTWTSPVPLPPAAPGMFIGMDPPDHTRYRHLLTGQFTVRRMRRLTDRITAITGDHLDRMAAAGAPADLVRDYAVPIPALVICEMLGVPDDAREKFRADITAASHQDTPPADRQRHLGAVTALLGDLITAKRADPGEDILGGLITDGPDLTDAELVNLALLLLGGGLDTTANVIALGAFTLLRDGVPTAPLTDPATSEDAVEELLRYLPVVPGTVRSALTDVELEGVRVAAGESVMVSLPTANRDPEHIADPDTLDLTRPAAGHLAFGHGVHQCLGQQLARVELRVALPALFRRFPDLRLAADPADVPLRDDMVVYGVHALPVTWGPA